MSWSNPTSEEASQNYAFYKNQYNNAAQNKYASEKQELGYINQKNAATNQLESANSQKLNFEKRIAGISEIINLLEGTPSRGVSDVPSVISEARNKLSQVDEVYNVVISFSGTEVTNFGDVFENKTVEGDINSSSALQSYKNEKTRIEQSLENVKSQINSLTQTIESLNRSIASCNSYQASCQSTMSSSAYEMNHYQPYLYQ